MRKISAVVGAGLLAASLGAQATDYDQFGLHDSVEVGVGIILTDGNPLAFIDNWFFAIAPAFQLTSVSLTSNKNDSILNIANGTYLLMGAGIDNAFDTADDFLVNGWPFDSDGHSPAGVGAGIYKYIVTGIANGSAGGVYTLASTVGAIPVPVPVPAPALLLGSALAGLGLLRRKREA